MPPVTTPLLSVSGLKTSFLIARRYVTALDGVSFTLNPGETLGLVGESGCGKTVTALSILRLLPPTSQVTGGIDFSGRELLDLPEAQMRRLRGSALAMVFQEPMTALNPVLTIGEQIAEVLRVHRSLTRLSAWQEAARSLVRVGLSDPERRLAQYPHQLSGGLRQRAMIAMALVCQPRLLIADEPTTALDVTIQAQILSLLAQLQKELQMAVLLITHNLGVVAQVAHRVAVMYAGLIVESAPTASLFAQPRHPYTVGLLAAVPKLDFGPAAPGLYSIRGQVPGLEALPPGCHFQPRCEKAFGRCLEPPPWVEVAPGHGMLCWLYK